MIKKYIYICFLAAFFFLFRCADKEVELTILDGNESENTQDFPAFQKLSDYNAFEPPLNTMIPKEGIVEYDLNSSLFSDHAYKKRFIQIPNGQKMQYHPEEAFEFPEGSIIYKFFYYPADFSQPDKDISIVETRVLLKKEGKWEGYTYIWDEKQNDAFLSLAGDTKEISWIDQSGIKQEIKYSIPSMLACRSCHDFNGVVVPIGPAARHMNKNYFQDSTKNQLTYLQDIGLISELPEINDIPTLVSWESNKGDLTSRSRAYLDINCSHCHSRNGPAKNSGLFLKYSDDNSYSLGIHKPPVAAGRGSGGLSHDIVPGHPESSILVYRMKSANPGVMMPEIGKRTVHKEGVALISAWIQQMPEIKEYIN